MLLGWSSISVSFLMSWCIWGLESIFLGVEVGGFMQLDLLVVAESVLLHRQLVEFKPDVPMVFIDPSV